MLIVGAVVAFLNAFLGLFVSCKDRGRFCNVLFGVFMMISWLLLMSSGFTVGLVSWTDKSTLLQFCDKNFETDL